MSPLYTGVERVRERNRPIRRLCRVFGRTYATLNRVCVPRCRKWRIRGYGDKRWRRRLREWTVAPRPMGGVTGTGFPPGPGCVAPAFETCQGSPVWRLLGSSVVVSVAVPRDVIPPSDAPARGRIGMTIVKAQPKPPWPVQQLDMAASPSQVRCPALGSLGSPMGGARGLPTGPSPSIGAQGPYNYFLDHQSHWGKAATRC